MATTMRAVPATGGHEHVSAAGGHPQGARDGRQHAHPGAQDGGAASSVLVAPSLLLTSRDLAATVREARGRRAVLGMPWRAAGYRVALEPDDAFVTSPALGWTLVRVTDRDLPVVRVRRLPGLVLPPVCCGVRTDGALRWVDGGRIVADLDLRLRVLGGQGDHLRRELRI